MNFPKWRSLNKCLVVLINCAIVALFLISFIDLNVFEDQFEIESAECAKIKENANNSLYKGRFLICSETCPIPDFPLWNPEILPLLREAEKIKGPECHKNVSKWSYMDHTRNSLVFDTKQIKKDGWKWTDLNCCLMFVLRDETSDSRITYTPCQNITSTNTIIPPENEFLVVQCRNESELVYRMFHAVPPRDSKLEEKILRSKSLYKEARNKPPNVIILMQDSTSRLNFQRYMNKTRKLLESIGAVEMIGHTKVGDSTYMNAIPFFTGYRAYEDLPGVCIHSMSSYDECPFIWKEFGEAGYLTGIVEDCPSGHISANLGGTYGGFQKRPVDFYTRPFFLAAHEHDYPLGKRHDKIPEWLECIGYQTNSEFMLEYLGSTLDLAKESETPLFNAYLSATSSHDFISGIKNEDEFYQQFLLRLIEKGHLKNTILFVMGDHGYRYGPIRHTLQGDYEDNLPNMWIYLPPWIRQNYPHWHQGLLYNSQRLTSHFMLYWTMQRILNEFAPKGRPYKAPSDAISRLTGEIIQREFKHDFFNPLPNGFECKDLGIPLEHCPCYWKTSVPSNSSLLIQAAELAIAYINNHLISLDSCEQLSLLRIHSGQSFTTDSKGVVRYLVKMLTTPGEAFFEAELDFHSANSSFAMSKDKMSIKRINVIDKSHVECTHSKSLKMYCYCKERTIEYEVQLHPDNYDLDTDEMYLDSTNYLALQ